MFDEAFVNTVDVAVEPTALSNGCACRVPSDGTVITATAERSP